LLGAAPVLLVLLARPVSIQHTLMPSVVFRGATQRLATPVVDSVSAIFSVAG